MSNPITPEELIRRRDAGESIRLIDVRESHEYQNGHIPGAESHPLSALGDSIEGVSSSETVVVVCQAGVRSAKACSQLDTTYAHLYDLSAGTGGWIAQGLPTVTV